MAKKKNIKVQDVSIEDMDYIDYKMNPDSDKWKSYDPKPYVDYQYSVKLKCKNEKQKEFLNLLKDDSKRIVCAMGAAGCGKTHVAWAYALQGIKTGKFKKVVSIVPTCPAGSPALNLGFLKGTYFDKILPYITNSQNVMCTILDQSDNPQSKKIVDGLIRNEICDFQVISFIRGMTYGNAVGDRDDDTIDHGVCLILDEAENFNIDEMILLLTRIGENCKIIVLGDPLQCDRNDIKKSKFKSGIEEVIEKLQDMDEFAHIHFERSDSVRSRLITKILDRLVPES